MSELSIDKQHSLISPSMLHRLIACPGSVRLTKDMPNVETIYAATGTECHLLCEWKLKKHFNLLDDDTDIRPTLKYYSQDMENNSDDYSSYVISKFNEVKAKDENTKIIIEELVDLKDYISCDDAKGSVDSAIIGDGTCYIFDYKNGANIVSANGNPQLKAYALGLLKIYGDEFDVKDVVLTIVQPVRENISSFSLTREELNNWAKDILYPKCKEALSDNASFNPTEDGCRFCKAKELCRYRKDYLIREDFMKPKELLDDKEILEILGKAEQIIEYCNDIRDYCLAKALAGKKWDGYKVVEGRSSRKYSDESKVAEVVKNAGFDPYEQSLKNLTTMSKMMGKTKFETLLKDLLIKPQGKPQLAKMDDPRIEISTASMDFKNNNI